MFMWRNDKQLMEDSLKKAFALRESDRDERLSRLINKIREQDEQLKRDSGDSRAA
jgi:hypothetical protein